MSQTKNDKSRFHIIDELRGIAVLLMVIFHFAYDLNLFEHVSIDFQKDQFWFALPKVIVFLFLFCVGESLCIAHGKDIKWQKFWRRWGLLVVYALIISISTYFMFPDRWIYWGTLHCISFCSLAALPFLNRPNLSLGIALPMLILALFFGLNIPWIELSHRSMDYIAPFPWFAVTLIGIFAAARNFHQFSLPQVQGLTPPLRFMGKHALIIYVIHQPLMFFLFKLFNS